MDKARRQKRIQQKKNHIKRQYKIAKEYEPVAYLGYKPHRNIIQPHRLAKMRATDCGKPNCMMCANPRRTMKEKTMQELKFEEEPVYYDD